MSEYEANPWTSSLVRASDEASKQMMNKANVEDGQLARLVPHSPRGHPSAAHLHFQRGNVRAQPTQQAQSETGNAKQAQEYIYYPLIFNLFCLSTSNSPHPNLAYIILDWDKNSNSTSSIGPPPQPPLQRRPQEFSNDPTQVRGDRLPGDWLVRIFHTTTKGQ